MENIFEYKHNPIVKKIFFAMLIPTILMNLTTALASFADAVIIGYYLDDLSLSVITFATPIYMIINTFAALYAVGGSIAMGIDAGKGNKKGANKLFSISVELIVFTGVLLALAGLVFGNQITSLLGASGDVFDLVYDYAMIVLWAAPVFMLNIGFAFFVRNDGRPTLAMVGMFLSIAVNIAADILFVGVFDMGVKGAAYATVLGQLVSALVIATHFLTRQNTLSFRFAIGTEVCRIIRNGMSTALHFVYQFVTILILNHFVVSIAGAGGVVVYTVVFNLYTVSLALFEGLSQTVQPMVSVYYGSGSNRKIKNTLRHSFIATIVIGGIITLILELFPAIVPRIFGIADSALAAQSAQAVRVYSVSIIIMTVNVILGYYLQSTENNFISAVLVSLRCCILFLASAFVLGKAFGLNGVWGAYTAAEILTFIVFVLMVKVRRAKLSRKGVNADVFLLDKDAESATRTLVYSSKDGDFENFVSCITCLTEKNFGCRDEVVNCLNVLSSLCQDKNDAYIEVEVNRSTGRILITDNLVYPEEVSKIIHESEKYEYDLVLGWNRISFK